MFHHSLRWRMQIWLAVLLVGLLAAFGATAWQVERSQRVRRLDDELAKRAAALGVAIRTPGRPEGGGRGMGPEGGRGPDGGGRGMGPDRGPMRPPPPGDGWNRPFDDFGGPPGPPPIGRDLSISGDVQAMFPGEAGEAFYFKVWSGRSDRAMSSEGAPKAVPMPQREARDTQTRFRDRDGMREAYHFTEMGDCALVGRPVAGDLAGMRPFAARLSLTGLGVLAVGLGGGWWLTARSIRPIEQIADAAKRISEGKLSERIPAGRPGSELGQLAGVLNSTFERLEGSFARQKRFTSDASHELRTPLSVLIAETQTTLSRERSAEEYRETLEGNLDTARQMKRLAESLLELARLDAGERREAGPPFDLGNLADDVIRRLRPLADARSVSIIRDGAPAISTGSPERLALVISNLVENAIHYGRESGGIRVTTGDHEGGIAVRVKDDGPGIPEEDLPHVFDRFYRADRARTGSQGRYGLGLAICREIVAAEGGTITAESEPRRGTCFTVRLPSAKRSL